MRIIHITDTHVGVEGKKPFDVDVRRNFLNVLEATKDFEKDYIVLTGDLCYQDGDISVYHWMRKHLDDLDVNYLVIPGNHDDTSLLAHCFDLQEELKGEELYFFRRVEDYTLFFLDTAKGEMSNLQKNWLKANLDQLNGRAAYVFMHHPPLNADVPHMDQNYALKDMGEVQEIFKSYGGQVHIFSGHYHVDKVISKYNMQLVITPSCFVQIDSRFEEFKPDHFRVGFRVIDIKEKGKTIITEMRYIN